MAFLIRFRLCGGGGSAKVMASYPLVAVGNLFLFAVEDLERNDGSAEKPYFMSSNLKKLLKKTNKRLPEA